MAGIGSLGIICDTALSGSKDGCGSEGDSGKDSTFSSLYSTKSSDLFSSYLGDP